MACHLSDHFVDVAVGLHSDPFNDGGPYLLAAAVMAKADLAGGNGCEGEKEEGCPFETVETMNGRCCDQYLLQCRLPAETITRCFTDLYIDSQLSMPWLFEK